MEEGLSGFKGMGGKGIGEGVSLREEWMNRVNTLLIEERNKRWYSDIRKLKKEK